MNNYEKYYYYSREQDKVVECTWDEYHDVKLIPPAFKYENLVKVKNDKFLLAGDEWDYGLDEIAQLHVICTLCLPIVHVSERVQNHYQTIIFSDDKDYDGYQKRYTCLNEAKKMHDDIVLKIIRREKINE